MTKRMLIDAAHADETRMVIIDRDRVQDYDFVTSSKNQIKGNIYLAKITRVEPSLQAAFVEYGGGKQGFLPFSEIHPDYYQLPQEDRQKLLEEQIAEAEAEEKAEDEAFEREQAARESRRRFGGEEGDDSDSAEMENPFQDSDVNVSRETFDVTHSDVSISDGSEPMALESFLPPSDAAEVTDYRPSMSEPLEIRSDILPEDDAETSPQPMEEPSAEASTEGETTAEDAEETSRFIDRNVRGFHRRYKIQEVIKRNQIVLVQVIKEERGNKGCSLTTFISLAGRCAVLMPNSPKGGGISRKITDRETRRRLKEVASEMRTHRGMSVIIRTAGTDLTKTEIIRDYEYLVKLWNDVRTQTLSSTAPALIYEEGNLIKRSLRDQFSSDIEEVIIEGDTGFEEAKDFMRMLMPTQVNRVKLYKETMPLFSFAGVEDQLMAMTEPQVKLPSGGYLVINPTEALISIDVNSGRSTTERNVEETALKTNMEAAAEIGRQLRLRDLAGIIVIDFIDMNYGKNRKAVERAMKDAVRGDRAKISLSRISMFGLLEMSRQRMRPSISESMGSLCPHCRGSGHVHSVETIGIQIIRTLEKEAAGGEYATLRVTTHPEAALHLLNDKRALLQSIEQRYKVSVVILMDATMVTGNYRLIKIAADGKEILHDQGKPEFTKRGRGRRSRRGGSEGGRALDFSDAVEETDEEIIADTTEDEVLISADSIASDDDRPQRPRRERGERGERGGRNRRDRGGRNRDRGPRTPRPEGDTRDAAAPVVEGSETTPEGRDERGHRRRGRRGGRNRYERGDRAPRTSDSTPMTESGAEAAPVVPRETWSEPTSYTAEPPRSAHVIPLSEAQTNPNAVASPIRSEDSGDSDKPKRKGWWARVLVD